LKFFCSLAISFNSLALNFKQMSLYLAPAFFCYLLAGCLRTRRTVLGKALATLQLAFTVLATFALCWLPFLGSAEAALAVVRRIFPVERHLYEDKVANLWCTLALLPFLKLKAIFPLGTLLRLALGTTLLGLLPPCGLLLARPSRLGFLLCADLCVLHIHSAAQGEEGVAQDFDAIAHVDLSARRANVIIRALKRHDADVQGGFPRGRQIHSLHSLHRSTPRQVTCNPNASGRWADLTKKPVECKHPCTIFFILSSG
jgi:hypothetical protein